MSTSARFVCPECDSHFSGSDWEFREHVLTVHLQWSPIQCARCDHKVATEERFKQHCAEKHPKQKRVFSRDQNQTLQKMLTAIVDTSEKLAAERSAAVTPAINVKTVAKKRTATRTAKKASAAKKGRMSIPVVKPASQVAPVTTTKQRRVSSTVVSESPSPSEESDRGRRSRAQSPDSAVNYSDYDPDEPQENVSLTASNISSPVAEQQCPTLSELLGQGNKSVKSEVVDIGFSYPSAELPTSGYSPTGFGSNTTDSFGVRLSSEYQTVRKSGTGSPIPRCHLCGVHAYNRVEHCFDHMTRDLGLLRHKCKECDYTTNSSTAASSHMHAVEKLDSQHKRQLNIYMNNCFAFQATTASTKLKNRHTGSQKDIVRSHFALPFGDKLECRICRRTIARNSFSQHSEGHLLKITGLSRSACALCGKAFCNKSAIKGHVISKHPEVSSYDEQVHVLDRTEQITEQWRKMMMECFSDSSMTTIDQEVEWPKCKLCAVGVKPGCEQSHVTNMHIDYDWYDCPKCPKSNKARGKVMGHIGLSHNGRKIGLEVIGRNNTAKRVSPAEVAKLMKTAFQT